MNDTIELARGWYRKAESDLTTVRLILASEGPYDTACFHAQQAVEKYLKGYLALVGEPFPPTHNLEQLEQRCAALKIAPDFSGIDVALLTPYAVQMRYDPDFWPDQAVAEEACDIAVGVRVAILAVTPLEAHP